jgi:hypothetical protein
MCTTSNPAPTGGCTGLRRSARRLGPSPLIGAIAAAVLSSGPLTTTAWACDSATLRDAAYDEPRDMHRLCVMGRQNDAAAGNLHDRLAAWIGASGAGLNLQLISVAVDDPNVPWAEYGIPSAPPSSPVVVLAGRRTIDRKSFFVDHWDPEPSDADLEALKSSPLRETIRQQVGQRMALLLYVPGTGPDSGSAEQVVNATATAWSKKEPAGVTVIRGDRADRRERVLLAFAGIRPSGPDWVAVVFGRGKLMPPLQGAEITEACLNEQLESLLAECTCMRSPASLGVDLLMPWNEAADKAVVKLRTDAAPPRKAALDRSVAEIVRPDAGRRVWRSIVGTLVVISIGTGVVAGILLYRRSQGETQGLVP